MEEKNNKDRNELYAKAVKAGKRTYFFDVKENKSGNLYISITESKKKIGSNGGFTYEKHKIFLYKEDFIKFSESLQEVVEFVKENNPTPVEERTYIKNEEGNNPVSASSEFYSDIDFDSL